MPIESLKTIFFESVEETSMINIRRDVYGLMRTSVSEGLIIQRQGDHLEETEAFNLTYRHTKFGRCVRTIEQENREMRQAGMKVSQIEFEPRDAEGVEFNVIFEFAADQSDQHHGGDMGTVIEAGSLG